ncbi:MAG: S-layer homology domain-containing protein, partial [Tissierellales bacterium]|nr:S-layer homology domain-containing protein [Tissierellales bacterium]
MRFNLRWKNLVAFALVFCMIFMSISASADTYINDVSSPVGYENNPEWAGDRMFDWLNKGMISGYDTSSFRADDAITKAEFIAIVNMVFGYHDTEFKTFDDVSESDWFYYDVAKAVRAGYVNPNESSFKPESKISREEVTVMLAKVLRIDAKSYSSAARKFKDYSKIASENRQFINAMVEMGYIGGYSDHTFRPKDPIT